MPTTNLWSCQTYRSTAVVGYLFTQFFTFPGYLSPSNGIHFSDVPNGMAAVSAVPLLGWLQIIAFAGYAETKLLQKFNGNPAGDVGGDKWQRYEESRRTRPSPMHALALLILNAARTFTAGTRSLSRVKSC